MVACHVVCRITTASVVKLLLCQPEPVPTLVSQSSPARMAISCRASEKRDWHPFLSLPPSESETYGLIRILLCFWLVEEALIDVKSVLLHDSYPQNTLLQFQAWKVEGWEWVGCTIKSLVLDKLSKFVLMTAEMWKSDRWEKVSKAMRETCSSDTCTFSNVTFSVTLSNEQMGAKCATT